MISANDIYYSIIEGSKEVLKIKNILNKINVFPVADGDTGTNLSVTMKSIIRKSKADTSVSKTLDNISLSAIEGARGNSGVIMAQFIGGLQYDKSEKDKIDIQEFSNMCANAVKRTYSSLKEPVEGSILTVMRTWSDSLNEMISKRKEVAAIEYGKIFKSALLKAEEALQNTKNQMEILKKNNVVDSGAMGFVAFVRGITNFFINGKTKIDIENILIDEIETSDDHREIFDENLKYRYCYELLYENNENVSDMDYSYFGDSIISAGTSRLKKLHIHTNNPFDIYNMIASKTIIAEQKIDDMLIQAKAAKSRFKTAIVTDSIADLPKEYLDENGVTMIPISLFVGDREYLDKITITSDSFYDFVDKSKDFPSSSTPDMTYVSKVLNFLSSHFENVLIISVSSKLSGTYNTIRKVMIENDNFGINMDIVDTKLNSGAQGLIVKKAVEMVRENRSYDSILEKVNDMISRTKIFVFVNEFEYMVRGGRVSPLKGKIANLLNLKPIVTLDEEGAGKAFGASLSKKQIFKKIGKILTEDINNKGIERYSIVYSDNKELALEFESYIKGVIAMNPDYICPVSPVVGISAGRNTVAVSYTTKE